VAFQLADAFDAADKPDYERAVLETALERLSDDGHRHLVRCRLALEAIAEGDVPSAEGWLAECDPMPEVPELDSAYRRARAHVAATRGDGAGILGLVGREAGNMPVHPSQENAIRRLRIHGLDALGERDAADRALKEALAAQGQTTKAGADKGTKTVSVGSTVATDRRERFLQQMRKEKLGLRPLLRRRLEERNAVTGGTSTALASQLWLWPLRASLLFVVITIPRCFFDADPLLGVNGYALCPSFCEGCDGPFRIHTHWTHHDDSHSTDGPRYFCRKPGSATEELSDEAFFRKTADLSEYELYVAPAMTSYLILLGLSFVLLPFGVRKTRRRNDHRKDQLEREVSALAASLGEGVPNATADPRPLRRGLTVAAAAVVIPVLVTLLELAVR
jgi:hypothetical protein